MMSGRPTGGTWWRWTWRLGVWITLTDCGHTHFHRMRAVSRRGYKCELVAILDNLDHFVVVAFIRIHKNTFTTVSGSQPVLQVGRIRINLHYVLVLALLRIPIMWLWRKLANVSKHPITPRLQLEHNTRSVHKLGLVDHVLRDCGWPPCAQTQNKHTPVTIRRSTWEVAVLTDVGLIYRWMHGITDQYQ